MKKIYPFFIHLFLLKFTLRTQVLPHLVEGYGTWTTWPHTH